MVQVDEQDQRIAAVLGEVPEPGFDRCVEKFHRHLQASLRLPCEVTGLEDFDWEESYVMGPGDPKEYKELRRTKPSYRDKFELLRIEKGVDSEWMMFHGEDLGAHVRRKSDGREFCLGLAELKAVDKRSPNFQLINDYATWFVNNR
ncbi:MAG: hypothetical protein HY922_09000 [Elusimicrobia bacterium]|nr:hypothetical protein [Elusimicrobiota bacterium]